jgi:UDP-N-acetylmuramoylalanine--D-glutamate ligase
VRLDRLAGAPVVVAGAGVSGLAAARALRGLGALVTVVDAVPERLRDLPDGMRAGHESDPLPDGTALVVTGPGRRPDHPLVATAAALGIALVGEPELAWWIGAARPDPPAWLAVTGTNGKTTTVGMLEAILRAAGLDAVACGNIGYPLVDAVSAGYPLLAVELSSFQLHWSPSLRPAAGCVLNIAEDHLDWHGSMAAYAAAKARVLDAPVAVAALDDPGAAAVLAAATSATRVGVTLAAPAVGRLGISGGALVDRAFAAGVELCGVDGVHPAGPSGLIDALAAAALARARGVPPDAVAAGLAAFRPGCHRCADAGSVGGIRFVDDSKATNPHAADAALAAQPAGRVVWIAGGLLKGADVDGLVRRHGRRLRGAVVIGVDRRDILGALARHAPEVPVAEVVPGEDAGVDRSGVMDRAVGAAAALARPGDVVLLAPAAASMDQFADYADRGRAFAVAVAALGAPGAPGALGERSRG